MGSMIRVCVLIVLLVCFLGITNANTHKNPKNDKPGGLKLDFYSKSCPEFWSTVKRIISEKVAVDRTLQPKLLRLHYHDCFVRGCDASILLDSPNGDNSTEKSAGPNRSIAGYEVIDEIKAKLEKTCRGVVSCADIVAVAARDAVSFRAQQNPARSKSMHKQRDLWPVYTGRLDGKVSIASEASRDLPSGGSNFTTLLALFNRFNLSKTDLVALSGAHTIGVARCVVIQRRLNFTGKGDTDPSLSEEYAKVLRQTCGSPTTTVGLDRKSPTIFDSRYYSGLVRREGLLTSDSALLNDPEAKRLVEKFQNYDDFERAFAESMVNMGKIDVITGKKNIKGEIRKNCRRVNK